jgi:hypothetical protein
MNCWWNQVHCETFSCAHFLLLFHQLNTKLFVCKTKRYPMTKTEQNMTLLNKEISEVMIDRLITNKEELINNQT